MAGAFGNPHSTGMMASAYDLFRIGWGTDRIAAYWDITEAEASRRLTSERCNYRGLPLPETEAAA